MPTFVTQLPHRTTKKFLYEGRPDLIPPFISTRLQISSNLAQKLQFISMLRELLNTTSHARAHKAVILPTPGTQGIPIVVPSLYWRMPRRCCVYAFRCGTQALFRSGIPRNCDNDCIIPTCSLHIFPESPMIETDIRHSICHESNV